MVRLPRPVGRVAGDPRGQAQPGAHLHGRLLPPGLGQPADRRPHRSALPAGRPGGRAARALPRHRRRPHGLAAHRHLRAAGDHRRIRGVVGVELVGAVHQRRRLRHRGSAVPQRHRVLRLPAALPVVRGRLAVRVAADRHHRHGGGALPQWRHPGAATVAAGDATGEGPPVGPPRRAGAGQDGRLLAAALRAHHVDPRHRRRCQLHRRARAAPGAQPAGAHLVVRGDAVRRQHLPPGLDAPRRRRRPVAVRGGGGRRHLPAVRPAIPGPAQRVGARAPLHPAQHRGDPGGAGPGQGDDPAVRTPDERRRCGACRRGTDRSQHPPVGSVRPPVGPDVRAAAADPQLLQHQRRRR